MMSKRAYVMPLIVFTLSSCLRDNNARARIDCRPLLFLQTLNVDPSREDAK
jgi:hypothetical protein